MSSSIERYFHTRKQDLSPASDGGAASAFGDRIVSVDIHLRRPDGSFPVITPEVLNRARVAAFASYADKLEAPNIKQGVVVMGLPCSGKSRLVAALSAKYRTTVFFEATLSTHQERISLMSAAKATGKPVHVIHVVADHRVVMSRNRERTGNRRLPADAMLGMIQRLASQPPSVAEGFASVTRYSNIKRFEQSVGQLAHVFTGFDVAKMAYYAPADFTAQADKANPTDPIPLLGTMMRLCPETKVGVLPRSFEHCNNSDLDAIKEAVRAKGPDGKLSIDVLVIVPLCDNPGKPSVKDQFAYRLELLRRAIADDPDLAKCVVVSDVQSRIPGFPSLPAEAMNRLGAIYNREYPGSSFTLVPGADNDELSREIHDAVASGDLSAIASKVPRTTLAALRAEVAIKRVPLLQNVIS